jgi:hypothetical protein
LLEDLKQVRTVKQNGTKREDGELGLQHIWLRQRISLLSLWPSRTGFCKVALLRSPVLSDITHAVGNFTPISNTGQYNTQHVKQGNKL